MLNNDLIGDSINDEYKLLKPSLKIKICIC